MRDNGNGTVWVAPGMGATGADLYRAVADAVEDGTVPAWCNLCCDRRTNLALTGRPLTALDLERIASNNLEVSP